MTLEASYTARVALHGQGLLVKDLGGPPGPWHRAWSAGLARRESRVLKHLDGIAGIPHWLGWAGPRALRLEALPGQPFSRFRRGSALPPQFLASLETCIAACHARGIAHGDLMHRENIILTPRGRAAVVDFGCALRRAGFLGEILFPFGRWLDARALEKYRARFGSGPPYRRSLGERWLHLLKCWNLPRRRRQAARRT